MIDSPDSPLILEKVALSGLKEAAAKIISFAEDIPIWVFEAPMGAGKTTLIGALGRIWQFEDAVKSPTYGLVNEYINAAGERFYHFDFYRINSEEEALDIGLEEYFYSGRPCLVEWPSRIAKLIPEEFVEIEIKVSTPTHRQIIVTRNE